MPGNKSYLVDYEEIDGGFVVFGGNSKGGKITRKGKIRTGKLDFEDVYFLKELNFNLFSVSQMCDKKNNVLFTDTACVVLSPDFKLIDESHVLLKVPRKDNMYNFDLKNVIPQRVLTCLFVNATSYDLIFSIGGLDIKHALSFMRLFGCPITINTIDHLGSRPNCLCDIDALTKSMNYKPFFIRNQSNGSTGNTRVETVPNKNYILLPLWTQDPPFSSSSKDSPGVRFKPSGEEEKKDAEDPGNEDSEVPSREEPRVNQEKDSNVSSTTINNVSPTNNATAIKDNVVDENIVYGCADDPNILDLEEINKIGYAEVDDSRADISNLDTNFQVNHVHTTRINKMDVNHDFLYRKIKEEVYVCQPPGFEDLDFPDKVGKALYGLHQAPRACDYAEASLDRKSTIGGCQFLGCWLISWQCKKKTVVANSTTKAEERCLEWNGKAAKDILDTEETHPSDPTNEKNVPTRSNDPPLSRVNTLRSREDILILKESMELYTKLSDRVLNLETTKTAQTKEIANLKKRVKRLERERKSRTHGLERLYKVGLSARVESSANEKSLDEDIFGVNDQDDTSMFDADKDLQGEEIVVEKAVADKEVNAASITTSITVAATTAISFDEVTMAQALMEIKTSRPKAKSIVMQEPKPLKMKKKDHISFDEQKARRLQAEIEEKDRLTKEEAQKAVEANIAVIEQWHDVQAKIDADYELAQRLQAKEQEQLTDAKNARLFMEFIEKRRTFFVAKRNEEKRNRPLTKAQQISKHVCGYGYRSGGKLKESLSRDCSRKQFKESRKLLKNFNREDLEILWSIVKTRFEKVLPVDDMDSFLMHTLKTMFEHHVKDNVWKNQQGLVKYVSSDFQSPISDHRQQKGLYIAYQKVYASMRDTVNEHQ
nr:putative ribonuclease H-like domain-containing protein [Tanacetum cinerariifolium]